jgi:hypothetical protein
MTESQNYIEYQISNPVTDKGFVSRSYEEAKSYFDEGWYIVEKHIAVCVASGFISTYSETAITWNSNPEFEE